MNLILYCFERQAQNGKEKRGAETGNNSESVRRAIGYLSGVLARESALFFFHIFVAHFGILRFSFRFMLADQGIGRWMIGTQLPGGNGAALRTFLDGDDTGFAWIRWSGWHIQSLSANRIPQDETIPV